MGKGLFSLSGIGMLLQAMDLYLSGLDSENERRRAAGQPAKQPFGYAPGSMADAADGMLNSVGAQMKMTPWARKTLTDKPTRRLTPSRRVAAIIKMIQKYEADPRVREVALKAASRVRERDWLGEANAIFGMLKRHVRYTRDVYGRDTYVSPLRTLTQYKAGDCDDFTIAGGSLLRSLGFNVRVRIIQTKGNKTFNHVYLMVEIPQEGSAAEGFGKGRWIPWDASMPFQMGWQAPANIVVKHKDFQVPVGEMSRSNTAGIETGVRGGEEKHVVSGIEEYKDEYDDDMIDDDGVYYDDE